MKLVKGEKDPASFSGEGALPLKLKHLVALGTAIASYREPEVIKVRIEDCLKSGATN